MYSAETIIRLKKSNEFSHLILIYSNKYFLTIRVDKTKMLRIFIVVNILFFLVVLVMVHYKKYTITVLHVMTGKIFNKVRVFP